MLLSSLPDGGPPPLNNWITHQSINAPTGIIHQRLLIRVVTFISLPSLIGEGRAFPVYSDRANVRNWALAVIPVYMAPLTEGDHMKLSRRARTELLILTALALSSCGDSAPRTFTARDADRLDVSEINARRAAAYSSAMVDRIERLERRVDDLEGRRGS